MMYSPSTGVVDADSATEKVILLLVVLTIFRLKVEVLPDVVWNMVVLIFATGETAPSLPDAIYQPPAKYTEALDADEVAADETSSGRNGSTMPVVVVNANNKGFE